MMKELEKRIAKLEKLREKDKEAFLVFAKSYTTDVEEDDPEIPEEVFANHRGAKSVAADAETQRAETRSFNVEGAKNVAADAETHAKLSLSLSDLAVSETGLQGAKIVAADAETQVESSETPTPPVLVHLDDDFQGAKNVAADAETHATLSLSLSDLADSETRLQEAKNVAADAETQETAVKESAASGGLVKEAVKVIEAGKAPPPVRELAATFEGNGPVQGKTVAPPPARPSFASSVQKTNLKEQESVEAVEGKSAPSSSTGRKKRKRKWAD